MAGLTPFGIEIRKLRLDRGLRLLDMAESLKLSVAFLSAVETGRKPIPDGLMVQISRSLGLTAAELRNLRRAADQTRKAVPVEHLSIEQREFVAALARRLDDVPDELIKAVRKTILESISGEIPFERKRRGIIVPPMSTMAIRIFADKVRGLFVSDDTIEFPIMDVLEHKLPKLLPSYYLDVQDDDTMGPDEGRVIPGSDALILRTDVYKGAWDGDGRHRFTAGHELFHYLAHRNITFARTREDSDKIYCDSEWQADTFSASLFMSPKHAKYFKNSFQVSELCKVSGHAAHVTLKKYKSEGII